MTQVFSSNVSNAFSSVAAYIDFDAYRHDAEDDPDHGNEMEPKAAPMEKWWCPSRFHHSQDVAVWNEFAQRKHGGQTVTDLYRLLRKHVDEVNANKRLRDHYLLMPTREHFRGLVDQIQPKGH